MNVASPPTVLPIPLPTLFPKCTPHPCPPKRRGTSGTSNKHNTRYNKTRHKHSHQGNPEGGKVSQEQTKSQRYSYFHY